MTLLSVQGKMVKGPGGAVDLTASGSRVVVTMEHVAKVCTYDCCYFCSHFVLIFLIGRYSKDHGRMYAPAHC